MIEILLTVTRLARQLTRKGFHLPSTIADKALQVAGLVALDNECVQLAAVLHAAGAVQRLDQVPWDRMAPTTTMGHHNAADPLLRAQPPLRPRWRPRPS
jgi:hypothetical protein